MITRHWDLYEEGNCYDTVEADSAEEALDIARDNVDRANYAGAKGTIWIRVEVRCEETGEGDSATVTLDEDEPACPEGEHDWQSPYAILGGLKDNPGVWGKGAGLIMRRVCMHCGCERVTDTWAQNPETGEQGLTSVYYRPGEYAEEVEALRERG